MYESKYRIIVDDFGTVVDVGVQLTRVLEGRDVSGRSDLAYADVVFTSMVQFGQTLLDRVPGGNPQNLDPPWDMPTACLLSRAIIDAYQMLAYTSFAPIDEPERHLRILVMELHDLERRLQVLHSIYSADPKVSEFEAEATAKRSEILCHPQVASISLARQKKFRKAKLKTTF